MKQFSNAAIDRLGKRLRDSDVPDPADVAAYIEWSATFEEPLRDVLNIVDEASVRAGVPLDEKTSRIKQLYSIVAKLRRGHPRLSSIDDIAGCRVVVDRETDVNTLVLQLATANVKRVRDYRRQHRNGYRAVHLTLNNDAGQTVELQVRTEVQHAWAGVSERRAAIVGHAVKYGGGPPEEQARLIMLSSIGRLLDLHKVEVDARRAMVEEAREAPGIDQRRFALLDSVSYQEQRQLCEEVTEFEALCEQYAAVERMS